MKERSSCGALVLRGTMTIVVVDVVLLLHLDLSTERRKSGISWFLCLFFLLFLNLMNMNLL